MEERLVRIALKAQLCGCDSFLRRLEKTKPHLAKEVKRRQRRLDEMALSVAIDFNTNKESN